MALKGFLRGPNLGSVVVHWHTHFFKCRKISNRDKAPKNTLASKDFAKSVDSDPGGEAAHCWHGARVISDVDIPGIDLRQFDLF